MDILLLPNQEKDAGYAATRQVIAAVDGRARLFLPAEHAAAGLCGVELVEDIAGLLRPDCIIVLGGDGTLLGAAREVIGLDVPILGINLGHLGFLAEVERQEIAQCVERLLHGDYAVEARMMLTATVARPDGRTDTIEALNDLVITRAAFTRLIDLALYVDGSLVDNYSADGLICATPTGSTAYSLSAGGPIVDPAVDVLVVTPICPHKLDTRTIIAPAHKVITLQLGERCRDYKAMVTADGQAGADLYYGDTLTIRRSAHVTRLVRLTGMDFYGVLRKKLQGVT